MASRDRVQMLARIVLCAILAFGIVACGRVPTATPSPPLPSAATTPPTMALPSATASPSQPSASSAVTVRTLPGTAPETLLVLLGELINRLGPAGCRPGSRESDLEFGIPEET
jgi:hypothetical protein